MKYKTFKILSSIIAFISVTIPSTYLYALDLSSMENGNREISPESIKRTTENGQQKDCRYEKC